jgi:hypothetical protein
MRVSGAQVEDALDYKPSVHARDHGDTRRRPGVCALAMPE